MPFGDGTGPLGQGPGSGRGRGPGRGMGRGKGRGFGGGRGNPPGAGPGGYCVCPNPSCGTEVPHRAGVSCFTISCPKCGQKMIRR